MQVSNEKAPALHRTVIKDRLDRGTGEIIWYLFSRVYQRTCRAIRCGVYIYRYINVYKIYAYTLGTGSLCTMFNFACVSRMDFGSVYVRVGAREPG